MKDHVIIKSCKYGLTVYLDRDAPFQELLLEIENKFRSAIRFFEGSEMAISFKNRTLTEENERELVRRISDAANIRILCIVEQDEKNKRIYKSVVKQTLGQIPEPDGLFYRGTLSQRQILESERSIIIIGDVKEGATVAAKGSIIVLGALTGRAYAGVAGNKEAFIAALDMKPLGLCIADRKVKPVTGGSYSWARLS